MNTRTAPPVITLDGPAGSGKSTTARAVAERLGYLHLDSGAIYRAITLSLLESGIPEKAWADLTEADLQSINIRVEVAGTRLLIFLGTRQVEDELRTARVTRAVSGAAQLPVVRGRLLALQREAGRGGGLVADGRDMGTVVFPDADLKVFLTADLHERARRRLMQEGDPDPSKDAVGAEAARIAARDQTDSGRALAPLRQPEGALVLDTTRMTFEEQVQAIVEAARSLSSRD